MKMVRSQVQILVVLLILWSITTCSAIVILAATGAVPVLPSIAKPNCQSHCGDIAIPYPFGIGEAHCYLTPSPHSTNIERIKWNVPNNSFEILCNQSTNPPKPFLNLNGTLLQVLGISLNKGTVKVGGPITFSNCNNKPSNRQLPNLRSTPFWYFTKNKFTSVSCGGFAVMKTLPERSIIGGCLSICGKYTGSEFVRNNSCGGINCCQTTLPPIGLTNFETSFGAVANLPVERQETKCMYAFLVDQYWFTSNSTNISLIGDLEFVPVVLRFRMSMYTVMDIYGTNDWTDPHNSSYFTIKTALRSCSKGFQGNPYLLHGCKDIDECDQNPHLCGSGGICINYPGTFGCQIPVPVGPVKRDIIVTSTVLGVLFTLVGGWWSHKVIKKRRSTKRKHKFFKKNGGLLLKQQSNSNEGNVEKMKLFTSKELDKATDHYNVDRILGQGGQGTVYKGMLTDGRIVAVKKSKIAYGGDSEVRQFINEIVILSQVIHRNVVKLLGCCLETEVPLLVYEFVANGTLSEYIHKQNEDFPLTWEMRLKVAIETAGALSYLHSTAAVPIYHRDIKSSNILLDEKYIAKIADFGTSRSVAIDQTHVTTLVRGTFGYLDPEYFRSSRFTDKSDVYSFGVVLTELLTGQKPVSIDARSQEGVSLVNIFLHYMEQNSLFDILDPRIVKGCRKEEIVAVANLAERCLHLNGRNRPTMKEVACELEGIRLSSKDSDHVHQILAEFAYVPAHEIPATWEDVYATDSGSSSFQAQPLFTSNTV